MKWLIMGCGAGQQTRKWELYGELMDSNKKTGGLKADNVTKDDIVRLLGISKVVQIGV